MSVLTIDLLPQGMIFAADKNVTIQEFDPPDPGVPVRQGQILGQKVLKWPRNRALVGAVGRGNIGGQSTDAWLFDFMGDHVDFTNSESVVTELRDRLQAAVRTLSPARGLIVEFGTFGNRDGVAVPEMWHVTNIHGLDQQTGRYIEVDNNFGMSEEVCGNHFRGIPPREIRARLATLSHHRNPFWFHQGCELGIFNTLEAGLRAAFRTLEGGGLVHGPQSLSDWERHARMRILMYGAFFESFYEPWDRAVGGGADVVSIPWPED